MLLKKFLSYITFWKKRNTDEESSVNLKLMHGINRISILTFIVALIVMLLRYCR